MDNSDTRGEIQQDVRTICGVYGRRGICFRPHEDVLTGSQVRRNVPNSSIFDFISRLSRKQAVCPGVGNPRSASRLPEGRKEKRGEGRKFFTVQINDSISPALAELSFKSSGAIEISTIGAESFMTV